MRIKRYIPNISLTVLIIGLVFVMQTNFAHAIDASTVLKYAGFPTPMDLLNSFLAYIVNAILGVASFLLSMAASILDVSIKITLHIKEFVDATPAIYTVWQTLRDISGLFFIFALLYAAIRMITGVGKGPSYGDTIKNIIIAGIMINFSFFIVSVGIDASNVVSQAIYNAMIPNHATVSITTSTTLSSLAERDSSKPDISNIFMNSLKIQSIYNTQGSKIGVAVSDPYKIILIGVVGVIMMLTTAASFVLAAIAFIARIVILLFLLAFSPLWFAGTIIPGISKYVSQFKEQLIAQLIFMPVYLLLMYVALRILNESNIMGAATASSTLTTASANWAFPYIVLGVNFTMVIIMLNLPLIAGLSLGGKATDFLKKSTEKWSAKNMWKGASGIAGRNTLGQAAYAVNKSGAMDRITAWSPAAGRMVNGGLSKVSSAAFLGKKGGYDAKIKQREKDNKAYYKHLGENPDKEQAESNQATFRSKLAFGQGGIIGNMLFRADHESVKGLNKEADRKKVKDEGKKSKEERDDLNKVLIALKDESGKGDAELEPLVEKIKASEKVNGTRKALGLESTTKDEEQKVSEILSSNKTKKEKIDEIQKKLQELGKKIKKADEFEEEDKEEKRAENLAKKVAEKNEKPPKDESGGDKPKDEKKT